MELDELIIAGSIKPAAVNLFWFLMLLATDPENPEYLEYLDDVPDIGLITFFY